MQFLSALKDGVPLHYYDGVRKMNREHLLLLKGKIEEIEDKIADLKALLSLIEAWEKRREMEKNSEYNVKMRYVVNTPKPATIVVTVMCEGESEEAMREVDDFAKVLDKKIREFLEKKRRGEE